MKQFSILISVLTLMLFSNLKAQNDTLYFWKGNVLDFKQSVRTFDVDSITFTRPIEYSKDVIIGNQVWTYRNLDVTTYSDGTPIPQVTDPAEWANLKTGAWCYYSNDPAQNKLFGKLYNWYAVVGIHDNDLSTPNKSLAPNGWRIPSDDDWTVLTNALGSVQVAGGFMKEAGELNWKSPNVKATNSSGFTGLPGGYRDYKGNFSGKGLGGNWWSSSADNATLAWFRGLINYAQYVNRTSISKETGCSVRCVKN
jgi:uncharacterized protein (TIGR02145 family)